MTQIPYLDEESPVFPPTDQALGTEPNGLLAVGGNLQPGTLLAAYAKGIFPWYSPGEPILWWSPSPRMALGPDAAHFSKSLKKFARKKPFRISVDQAFEQTISHCANTERPGQQGTWISEEMREAYLRLHALGYAHSVEAWNEDTLVGGLYGIALGGAFFGESMFCLQTGASKIAFASLCKQLADWEFSIIDCQVYTPLLASFGASEISRSDFETKLAKAQSKEHTFNWARHWTLGEFGFDGS